MTTDAAVPVEHRWFGLDRRTFRPALIALAIALLLSHGWAAVSAAIPWHNEIEPGDVLGLGAGATAVPPVGWQLQDGTLAGSGSPADPTGLDVLLATGGATVQMRGAAFTGTAGDFLDQVERDGVDARRSTVTTDAGLVGVAQTTTSPSADGLDVAFKMAPGAGQAAAAAPALLVRFRAAPGQFEHYRGQVDDLVRSITPEVAR